MRILVVTQYFWPENFRINDLCGALVARGHKVTILTGKPNYPDGEVFKEYRENKSSFMEYQGGNIVRVPMLARGKNSALKLIANYASYIFSASISGAWKLRNQQFDVIFVYEPSPVTVCLPAIFLKKIKKTPIVFWVQDLWPETLEAVGIVKSPKILSLIGQLVRFIYNRCDLILGQSRAFYTGIAKYCDDATKIDYFPNWSEKMLAGEKFEYIDEMSRFQGFFKVVFAGNLGEAQDFPAIIGAAQVLKAQKVRAKLFIVGDGRMQEWLKLEVIKQGLEEYVYLLGRFPLELMPSFYASADALLVSLKNSLVFEMTIPSKVQSYMSAGKPILTMLTGEGSRVIEEAKCGYIATSGDYDSLAKNIVRMSQLSNDERDELGDNAKTYSAREFDRDKLITQLEDWFIDVSQVEQAKFL